jgi:hypothetical protein
MSAQDARFEVLPWVRVALATLLFCLSSPGFVAAGLGAWGVRRLSRHWRALAQAAAVASSLLLLIAGRGILETSLGLSFDVVALILAETDLRKDAIPESRRGLFRGLVHGAALVFAAYLSLLVLSRPWHRHWGATATERARPLPGDEHAGAPGRAGDRSILIGAPAFDVWPWLLQMGEDRGGFYSHAPLENLFGLNIVNADRIIPEWQELAPGDFVRATPPSWMRGAFGDRVGWEVDHVDGDHYVLSLRYWIFEVEPLTPRSSRLHVRTHAGDAPVPVAPLLMLTFEPAHFVMERAMLFGVKARAERLAAARQSS